MQSCSGTCKSCSGTCKSCSGTCPGVPGLSYATGEHLYPGTQLVNHLPQLTDSLITIKWITLKARNPYWDKRLCVLPAGLLQMWLYFLLSWGGLLQFGLVESWQAPLPKIFFHCNLCFSTYLRSLSLTGFQTLLGLSIWIQRECIYQLIYQPTSWEFSLVRTHVTNNTVFPVLPSRSWPLLISVHWSWAIILT